MGAYARERAGDRPWVAWRLGATPRLPPSNLRRPGEGHHEAVVLDRAREPRNWTPETTVLVKGSRSARMERVVALTAETLEGAH